MFLISNTIWIGIVAISIAIMFLVFGISFIINDYDDPVTCIINFLLSVLLIVISVLYFTGVINKYVALGSVWLSFGILELALLVHEFRKGNLDVISRIGCCLLTGLTLISGVLLIIGVGV